ncbi:carbohydrate ABC transporter permease [Paenibacillus sp. J5C_2022]|uniref:carbohydrate ABC transporter permease n=1 Tax=Paenibacillus sp. J5C2022 TaxID=2977129 RepID=UPI0021CE0D23|nr:carbohydrate ABC transporter permease [Paenibacillus sp. J5C2022]MCU6709592.1 carbohydrate ABC transporter permease [Paenibacillus sp. J5C2022]
MEHLTAGERVAKHVNIFCLIVIALLCLFPFYYVVVISISPESEVIRKGIIWFPEKVAWSAYAEMINGKHGLLQAYQITIFRTVIGTLLNLLLTFMTAYPLSKKTLPGRSGFILFIVFTMLFNGGLIPTYLVVQSMGLLDTVWALIIPGLIGTFYVIIMKSFFEQLPTEIGESAMIDGAGEWQTMLRIVFPLTMPVMATVGLFYAVYHWNSYFDAVMYLNDVSLHPLQVVLRNILLNVQMQNTEISQFSDGNKVSMHSVKMAAVVLTTVPILVVYPFIQKYFTKGVMLGSVKG